MTTIAEQREAIRHWALGHALAGQHGHRAAVERAQVFADWAEGQPLETGSDRWRCPIATGWALERALVGADSVSAEEITAGADLFLAFVAAPSRAAADTARSAVQRPDGPDQTE
jgi:hypothetical protein